MFKVSILCEDVMESFINTLNNCNLRKVEKSNELKSGTYMVIKNEILVYSSL